MRKLQLLRLVIEVGERIRWRELQQRAVKTLCSIEQQLEHHRTRTFQEEYLAFLKKHGAHFDEKHLWD